MKKDLKRTPQNVTEDVWYYEENDGITVVCEKKHGIEIITTQAWIPWGMIKASVRRLIKKP